MNYIQIIISIVLVAAFIYQVINVNWNNSNDLIEAFRSGARFIKKLILISALIIVTIGYANAQTKQYLRIETTHFKGDNMSSKLVKYTGGTIDIEGKQISIDKEAPKPSYYTVVSQKAAEPEDEGYYSVEYICITENKKGIPKAVVLVAIYTPKKQLCDLIVKNGKTNVDYCLTDK